MDDDFELELKSDVKIDLDNPHKDMSSHAEKYMKWGRRMVKAKRLLGKAKNKEKIVYAELRKEARQVLTPKPTAAEVDDYAVIQDKYKQALADLIDAQEEYDLYEIIVNTFEHRRSALTRIIGMNEKGLYGTVSDFQESPQIISDRLNKLKDKNAGKE